jgi:endonuclease/exonuclease/phosphatase family metal-dependent hydrolase
VLRARLIPDKVMAESPDVVVFEESFDAKAVNTIRHKLKVMYPYIMGWQNRKVLTYKRAGGVLIFSKYPMREIESIKYGQCKGADCMGNKGAMLVEVDHPALKFQLLGTHMQAGGSADLKLSQYVEAGALLKRHARAGEPQFAAGDFNTRKSDTKLYPALVKELDATDGDITGDLKYTSDHLLNDMEKRKDSTKRRVIDYVFFKPNGFKPQSITRYVRRFTQPWNKDHQDLSDHFAIVMKMEL